jgi:aminoglycoside phosphotransferase (APT) family kinase protein
MRSRPPDQTIRWLVAALDATEVVTIEPMPGGSTAAMHRVTLMRKSEAAQVVVLRRYVFEEVVSESPDIAVHETVALGLTRGAGLPAPQLLAEDARAVETDVPTLVMSWLEGRPVWEPRNRNRFVTEIAQAMASVTDIQVPPNLAMRSITRYQQTSYDPPRWASRPKIWERAAEVVVGPIPADDCRFVHRDFHPGNLLWSRRHLTGIIDWQASCLGPASIDPGHCRLNMLYYDPPLADELRRAWEDRTGHIYDPWADIMSIIGVLDNIRTRKIATRTRLALEGTLAQALSDLGG